MFRKFKELISKPDKEKNEKWREDFYEEKPTGKDLFAMIFSAFLTIVLPISLILIGFGALMLLLFGGFR